MKLSWEYTKLPKQYYSGSENHNSSWHVQGALW